MEVVISVGLLVIVSLATVSVVVNILKSATRSQAAVDVQQTSDFIYAKFKNDLENVSSIDSTSTTLTINKGGTREPVTIVYTIESNASCNPLLGASPIHCLKRTVNAGASALLTEATSVKDPSDPLGYVPSMSAVSVRNVGGSTSYFEVIKQSDVPLAVNIMMEFFKPSLSGDGDAVTQFKGISTLNTTIVLD